MRCRVTVQVYLIAVFASGIFADAASPLQLLQTLNVPDIGSYLEEVENLLSLQCKEQITATWNYFTNITEHTKARMAMAEAETSDFKKEVKHKLLSFPTPRNETLQRQIDLLTYIGPTVMEKQDFKKYIDLKAGMMQIYSSSKVCDYRNKEKCDLSLEPELTEIFEKSQDYNELKYYWEEWRRVTGMKMKADYQEFISLGNKAAQIEGFSSIREYWLKPYEDLDFMKKIDDIWREMKPTYQLLYAYVRLKLKDVYGPQIKRYGRLPPHVFGNMWAQSWGNLYEYLKLDDETPLTVTSAMQEQNYTVKRMFETAEEFFVKIGMEKMTEAFWQNSILEKPKDREIVCHASAEDFCQGRTDGDYRIKMCTRVEHNHMSVVHHEMGHVQYFMHYRNQPKAFRDGANPGFHEAIGDVLVLAFNTPKHLSSINLLNSSEISGNTTINFLLRQALSEIPFLPHAYSLEKWRYELFDGKIAPEDLNKRWWEIKGEIQGISPPEDRSGPEFFDPGAKFHVPDHTQYLPYFVAFILKFQIYKRLCELSGHEGPLYQCDFSDGNKLEAGKQFSELLRKGYSQPWTKTLKEFGIDDLSPEPMKEYFNDLIKFMKNEVKEECLDYEGCEKFVDKLIMQKSEKESEKLHKVTLAEWKYATDITPENEAEKIRVSVEHSAWAREWSLKFQEFDTKLFKDEEKKRSVDILSFLGDDALERDQMSKFQEGTSRMNTRYSKAKICPYSNQKCDLKSTGLSLSGDLSPLMALSKDYDELAYVWKAWRDAAGKPSRKDFSDSLHFKKKIAEVNGADDYTDVLLHLYEEKNFKEYVERIWIQLEPLYRKLHGYVRYKLRKIYPGRFAENDPIPAHILGNMWAQSWVELYDDLKPYAEEAYNVTDSMISQNYTVERVFDEAEKFFVSLSMDPMTEKFKKNSLFRKPEDRDVVCHASAWDMFAEDDFRIKMCTHVTEDDFYTVHHEMGHVQYYMNYKHQPIYFRSGANPGFHEAVGDTVALSVLNPAHLKTIGLINSNFEVTPKGKINFQFKLALEKLVVVPWAFIVDSWRWGIYNGSTDISNSNRAWWTLREKYQGLMPPVDRSEEDFDPTAKYHVSGEVPYIRYFLATILQFQFHETLCHTAGFTALRDCDIYDSKAAGERFKKMLQLGSSKHWRDVLEEFSGGTRDIEPLSLANYFKELEDFLDYFILKNDVPIGWISKVQEYFH